MDNTQLKKKNKSSDHSIEKMTFKYLFSDELIKKLRAIEFNENTKKTLKKLQQEKERLQEEQQRIDKFNGYKNAANLAFEYSEYNDAIKQIKLASEINKNDPELVLLKYEVLAKIKSINKRKFYLEAAFGLAAILGLNFIVNSYIDIENHSDLSSVLMLTYVGIVITVLVRAFIRRVSVGE